MNQSAMLARFLRETAADVMALPSTPALLHESALNNVFPAVLEHNGMQYSYQQRGTSPPTLRGDGVSLHPPPYR
ncbi:hypothetical protein ABZ490_22465 [Streptomyces sp. NPDC005811]|uniref:hypothetical protein n=1 Tax=Streptomyces sp. NPDC005811 TaxID=3154565 RepID=UPI0034036B4E